MELRPFTIQSHCVASDEELYRNIASALARELPVLGQHAAHGGTAVLVGSGPSVATQVEAIRYEKEQGHTIIALKDAHDWLLERDIVPHIAVAIDPQESRATCFKRPDSRVDYFIASQCHPALFDHLSRQHVLLWHLYVRQGQPVPPHGTPLIAGGTTTGLRALTLFYSMGFRQFALYGFDSCLKDGQLRMTGDRPKPGDDTVHEIVVDGKLFYCNPSMTAQAQEFQNIYSSAPDIQIRAYGEGLIQTIVAARAKTPKPTISFLHAFGPQMASYRYRAEIPARMLGASLNDWTADVLIVSKPDGVNIHDVAAQQARGAKLIVDICDNHLSLLHYKRMLALADAVTCSCEVLRQRLEEMGYDATVIDDPYEFDEEPPHYEPTNDLLWFGHALNLSSLERIKPQLAGYPLRVVTNANGQIPWSVAQMRIEFALADIVVLPATAEYKSCNRAVEAIRQGCVVVAEPHPSLMDIPGIWVGNIKEGIEWASQHPAEANQRTERAQTYVNDRFSPVTVGCAWSRVIQACLSTSAPGAVSGPTGSTTRPQTFSISPMETTPSTE